MITRFRSSRHARLPAGMRGHRQCGVSGLYRYRYRRGALANISAKTGRTREQALAEFVAQNPQRRLIQPLEVAETVGWLCLPSSASITGQSIIVAGGELM